MGANFEILVENIEQEEYGYMFTLLVSNSKKQEEYKIYASNKDLLLKEPNPTQQTLEKFATTEMRLWIEKSDRSFPKDKVMNLMNLGKIPTKNKLVVEPKDIKVSDLIRTNVTIAAPLFEWAKAKAQNEDTSFSDLVSRGLLKLKVSDKEIEAWFKKKGTYFREKHGDYGSFEVLHYLPNNYTEFSTEALKSTLQRSQLRRTGWPIGLYLEVGENRPQPTEDGIKAEYADTPSLSLDYWYAKNKAEFYFSRNLESDSGHSDVKHGTVLYFDTLVWRVAESIEHCLAYYKNLDINQSEKVKLRISLYGLSERSLSAWNVGRAFTPRRYVCSSDKSSWETEVSLRELENHLDEIINESVKKLLVMFDFFVLNKEVVFDILNREYRKSSM